MYSVCVVCVYVGVWCVCVCVCGCGWCVCVWVVCVYNVVFDSRMGIDTISPTKADNDNTTFTHTPHDLMRHNTPGNTHTHTHTHTHHTHTHTHTHTTPYTHHTHTHILPSAAFIYRKKLTQFNASILAARL